MTRWIINHDCLFQKEGDEPSLSALLDIFVQAEDAGVEVETYEDHEVDFQERGDKYRLRLQRGGFK